MTTVLGFDFGLKHVGVAVGQTVTGSANPLGVIRAREGSPDWRGLDAMMEEWRPTLLIVGLPLNMDGTVSEMAARAKRFANRLKGRYGLEVALRDERLTSFAARSVCADPDARHAVAAQLILESWLAEAVNDDS